ncbi:hypothetical protein A7E78_12385 [Syntrophotalea acetylenivorans]|uniref:Uncharacterized protein n=1 Tax=Syntrophotalea acetylenivorans TaxID=1842532 RepID=A0A1L3GRT3_9BACT|nr:hypothetical protein A7E78_12385 [Syntrophotalea acetylenivorans]
MYPEYHQFQNTKSPRLSNRGLFHYVRGYKVLVYDHIWPLKTIWNNMLDTSAQEGSFIPEAF